MTSYHPSKTTWLNPNIEYLFNEEIIEYDIHDAGFSIIQRVALETDVSLFPFLSLFENEGFQDIATIELCHQELLVERVCLSAIE